MTCGFENFERLRTLGQGYSGKIVLALKKDSQELYALKMLNKKDISSDKKMINQLLIEREILCNVEHPF